jgi:hypothetical protein
LRDGDFASRRTALVGRRQLKQRFCQPRRQIQECHVLDLLARPAQTRTENLDKFDRHVRMVAQERHEIAPLDDNKLAVGHGGGIRGARPAVKQGDLTENLTLAKDVEHDVLALGRGNTHLDASGEYSHQPGAWVSFREYRGAPRHLPRLHIRPEMFDHRGRKILKQGMIAEQGQPVPCSLRRRFAP